MSTLRSEIGSAEAATSMPSQNPNKSPQETAMGSRSHTTTPAVPATMTMEDRLADTLALVQGGNYADATAEERHQIIADLVEAMSDDEVRVIGAKVEAKVGRKQTAPGSRPDLFSTTINPVALSGLSLKQLADLYDAFETQMKVAAGLSCQPRFHNADSGTLNEAGQQIDLIHDITSYSMVRIIDEAIEREPTDRAEILTRAWLVSRDRAGVRDDFSEFFALVARENAAIATAENSEVVR